MKLKIGDKLYCHSTIFLVEKGKYYTVTTIPQYISTLLIMDNEGGIYGFDSDNYQKNFYTMRELRKMKLEKLKKKPLRDFASSIQADFLMPNNVGWRLYNPNNPNR